MRYLKKIFKPRPVRIVPLSNQELSCCGKSLKRRTFNVYIGLSEQEISIHNRPISSVILTEHGLEAREAGDERVELNAASLVAVPQDHTRHRFVAYSIS